MKLGRSMIFITHKLSPGFPLIRYSISIGVQLLLGTCGMMYAGSCAFGRT